MSSEEIKKCNCTSEACESTECAMKDLPPPVEMEHPSTESTSQTTWEISPEWGIRLLLFWNATSTFLSTVGGFLWRVGRGVWKGLQPEMFVFFTDSTFPYNKHDLNLTAPGIASIAWYYDPLQRTFIAGRLHDTSDNIRVHHLPFLSAEIKYEGLTLHDITEFMETIRWAGEPDQAPPSAALLLSAWSLHTGIVLHKSEGLKLTVIDDQGNEQNLPLRS